MLCPNAFVPAAACAAFIAASGIASGQSNANAPAESPAAGGSQEIIVSASRDHRAAEQIPANVTVLTADDLAAPDIVTIVDALAALDGVYFRSSSANAAQQEISMRGFGENSFGRVLVLLDGVRLNRPDGAGINWAQIPLNAIDRIEVLRGGHSALYGDNAVGGVINIVTRKGAREPEISASVVGGSHGLNVERISGAGSTGSVSYAANLERTQESGYRDRSAYQSWGGDASLGYDFSERGSLTLGLGWDTMESESPGGLTRAQMDEDRRQSINPNDDSDSRTLNASLALKILADDETRIDVTFSYGRKDITVDMESWQSFFDEVIHSPGITPRLTIKSELGSHANTFLAGADGYMDRLTMDRFQDEAHDVKAAAATIEKWTGGAYVHNEFEVVESLFFGLGGRLERAQYNADMSDLAGDDSVTHDARALDASLTWNFAEKAKAFARAGSVFRFPFVDEQISYIGYGSDTFYTELDPESGRNYELGATMALASRLNLGLTLFLLDMKDEISWDEINYRNENLDETRRSGIEASADWRIGRFGRLDANYTYTEAVFTAGENDGKDVPLAPRHKARVGATAYLPLDFSLRGVVLYTGDQRLGQDFANEGSLLSGYTLFNLVLRYTPGYLERWGVDAFAGVDNLFDKLYCNTGYRGSADEWYYPAAGRTFKFGLSCAF